LTNRKMTNGRLAVQAASTDNRPLKDVLRPWSIHPNKLTSKVAHAANGGVNPGGLPREVWIVRADDDARVLAMGAVEPHEVFTIQR
jgi:hypothetical protein